MMTAPTNVTFTSGTTITSEWLNGVNDYVNELDPADHSSANVTYDPPFTNSVATTVEDKLAQYISVKDFGAVGDGVTDDTIAINNALDSAAQTGSYVTVPNGTYLISGVLVIKNGLKGFIGTGGIIKSTTAFSYIVLTGIHDGAATNVSNCVIENIQLNANNLATVGILAENINSCRIIKNHIYNLPFSTGANGILVRTFKDGNSNSAYNIIAHNIITGSSAVTTGGCGIGIDILNADLNYGSTGTSTPTDYWKATFTAADATYKGTFNNVSNNIIEGSYYGISLSAASYNVVSNNNLKTNIRGISVQNCCFGNEIIGNMILDNKSSGIHLAYGSTNNNILSNRIYSSIANGEGLLQAYVGCAANKFSNNNVTSVGSATPTYFAYCAVMSYGNEFSNNTFSGTASKAMVGVESTWNTATTNPASRAYNNPAVGSGWANAGMTNVYVNGNTISGNASVPAIFFYQVTQGTTCSLVYCKAERNIIVNANQNYQLELAEDTAGNLTYFTLMNNDFYYNQPTPASFSLARGRAHFVKCLGNTIFNDTAVNYDFPSGTTTPSVATLDYVSTAAYVSPTTITNFTNGMGGQMILVRLSVNTTIQNSASIILKGGVNIVGASSNQYVSLINNGTAWVETSRNF